VVTRADVLDWWRHLVAGRCTRWEAAGWAERQIEQDAWDEELVLQGLLYLQTVDLVKTDSGPRHVSDSAAPFLAVDAEIGPALDEWIGELARFDADPELWMQRYFQRMLRSFAARHGRARAQSFGDKLVAHGDLTPDGVTEAVEGLDPRRS
jgi:hypothetical protein